MAIQGRPSGLCGSGHVVFRPNLAHGFGKAAVQRIIGTPEATMQTGRGRARMPAARLLHFARLSEQRVVILCALKCILGVLPELCGHECHSARVDEAVVNAMVGQTAHKACPALIRQRHGPQVPILSGQRPPRASPNSMHGAVKKQLRRPFGTGILSRRRKSAWRGAFPSAPHDAGPDRRSGHNPGPLAAFHAPPIALSLGQPAGYARGKTSPS